MIIYKHPIHFSSGYTVNCREGLTFQVYFIIFQVYARLHRAGVVPSDQELKEQEKQLQKIQKLYKRQVRVPLRNCNADSLLEEASEYFEGELEKYMHDDLKKSQNTLKEISPYEDELVSTVSSLFCLIQTVDWNLYIDTLDLVVSSFT